MEFLRRIIYGCVQGSRVHYEKIILLLALSGLGVAVVVLYLASQGEADTLRKYFLEAGRKAGKVMPPISLAHHEQALKRVATPPGLNLSTPHNLFNPVKWQRQADGSLLKIQTGKEIGPFAMSFSQVTPLHYTISLDRVASAGGYYLGVIDEAAAHPLLRRKRQKFCTLSKKPEVTKSEILAVREIKGPLEDPTELVVELAENGEKVSVLKGTPYRRLDGYEVDLKYPIEGKNFAKQRVGDTLRVAGEGYKIVAISPTQVVLSASLNDKKYTVRPDAGR